MVQEKPKGWAKRIVRLGRLMGRYEQLYMSGIMLVGALTLAILFVLR